ncbi:cyclin-dependent kinase inhibitor 1B-like [Coccinella septempunctata]|uniref:cyclin-dependent kinase inhibitor 1B-like n=1 Tax=Coccinella septempunctata TaxID=41139 RepID=UPI001D06C0B0|nr:cyclin-dependent kinase inhibitor 1B-like [Coccinella septempunctata]XP_044749894.1 cyclin-dependent kinase inhibitor 1B-like [Coccinella septempunctata]XP_044749895.1 cyclin-dependent kinase inhibitor 1B-like [Coccinella septempunctata]XP_044749896.1 cyclin-dependent kinase inhibitor 1B-like [Coccinella septempunctata]XP_044749897.1 cyclin-dependent kinase inhibitor 1B-like [Coccinella septempunctata]
MADNARDIERDANDDRRRRLTRVRRRLDFGDEPVPSQCHQSDLVDCEEAMAMLDPVISRSNEASAKWNFDFANEVPLEGVWEWEKVESRSQQDYKELTIVRENKEGDENRSI